MADATVQPTRMSLKSTDAIDSRHNIFESAEKHSVTVAGHATSLRIEPIFWNELIAVAEADGLPVNAVLARIDAARLLVDPAPNLASAVRQWLFANCLNQDKKTPSGTR